MTLNLYGQVMNYLRVFQETVTVQRRGAGVDQNGRAVVGGVLLLRQDIRATVTPIQPSGVARDPAYQLVPSNIEVETEFPLRGPNNDNPGILADQIVYHGHVYVVKDARTYQKFNIGFVTALAELVNLPVLPDPPLLSYAEEDA